MFVGIMNKIAIDIARAMTPPSLLGIDRRIAYANRRYHSGWMWTGVTRGFARLCLLRSLVRIPPEAWIFVCCECRVLSGRGVCDELITRPEESYRLCCVVVCDLETSRMGTPYIYMTLVT